MPAGKHIYVDTLQSNKVGSFVIPKYVHIHQSNSPVVRSEYIEVQEISQISYKSLHTVIKVGKKRKPIIAIIIPGVSIPLLMGMNYKDFHAEDPDTQHKLGKLNTPKIFFLQGSQANPGMLFLHQEKPMIFAVSIRQENQRT